MRKKDTWWTIQLIPHGKGSVQSFKVKYFPIMVLLSTVLLTTLIAFGLSFFLWNQTTKMDERINAQTNELTNYINENVELRERLANVNGDLIDLHNDLQELQNYIQEMERLEQQIKGLDDSTSLETADGLTALRSLEGEERQVKNLLTISSAYTRTTAESMVATPNLLRLKITELKTEAEEQQSKLTDLKEFIEEENYKAQFIPSIPPADGRISSSFGFRRDPFHGGRRMHNGIDFVNYHRAPIYAAANGRVTFAGRNGGYGNQIVIDHGNGYKTTYSHLSTISVKKGDRVEMGNTIGTMGSTGRSTGVHLHYEVHKNGTPINPITYIKGGKTRVVQKASD